MECHKSIRKKLFLQPFCRAILLITVKYLSNKTQDLNDITRNSSKILQFFRIEEP
jgi:hypothetical protein